MNERLGLLVTGVSVAIMFVLQTVAILRVCM